MLDLLQKCSCHGFSWTGLAFSVLTLTLNFFGEKDAERWWQSEADSSASVDLDVFSKLVNVCHNKTH